MEGGELNQQRQARPLVLVVGMSGAGKTYLLSQLLGTDLGVGNSLKSETAFVSPFMWKPGEDISVQIVDSPGFNDTNMSDEETFLVLSEWLTSAYRRGLSLNSIVLVYDIEQPRVPGTTRAFYRLIRELCGESFYPNLMILINKWNPDNHEEYSQRENELRSGEWKLFISNGAEVEFFTGTKEGLESIFMSAARNQKQ